jgi:superfamily II DNA/RNA helicase
MAAPGDTGVAAGRGGELAVWIARRVHRPAPGIAPDERRHVTKTFRDLGVDGALCDALATEGITHPFPIQELTLPLALGGNDLIGQARTGTGKTLAFGLPLLQRLDPSTKTTQALIVVPTRELCLQVFEDLKIGAARGLTSVAVYGGVGFEEQIAALQSGGVGGGGAPRPRGAVWTGEEPAPAARVDVGPHRYGR